MTERLRNSRPSKDAVFGTSSGGGATGATGPSGGPTGATGPTGPGGGATGATGPAGSPGGATGATGPAGGASLFSAFTATMPPDNPATVAAGNGIVDFPTNGPTNGAATRVGATPVFTLAAGTYRISWQVATAAAAQLEIWSGITAAGSTVLGWTVVGGARLMGTTVGRAVSEIQSVGDFIVTVGATTVAIVNPGLSALAITPIEGGPNAVTASLNIVKLA